MYQMILAILVFIVSYALIISEKLPHAIITILGATSLSFLGVLSNKQFFAGIDMEVIFLLIGMMIIVHIVAETGIFEWVSIKTAQMVRGKPFPLLILLCVFTAVFSAFLDNVTTIIVMVPVSMLLAKQLGVSPIPYVISQVMASNIGGAATLIGDPPNLVIASESGYTFNQFLYHLTPIAVINMFIFVFLCWVFFRKDMATSRYKRAIIMEMDTTRVIRNPKLLKKSLCVFGAVVIGFIMQRSLNVSPAIIALAGAAFLIGLTKKSPDKILKIVEWDTIFFFIGLFIIVHGLKETGVLQIIAEYVLHVTKGSFQLTSMAILWVSSVVSAVLDNIPYTTTIAPMIKDVLVPQLIEMNPDISPENIKAGLWWALSLGACLGGNGTLIGASANVVAAGQMQRSGYKLSFLTFTKYGVVVSLATTLSSALYIWFRYLNI